GLSEHALDRGSLAEQLGERVPSEAETRAVSTGSLVDNAFVDEQLALVLERYRSLADGAVADYIPVLAGVDAGLFGIALLG
ncbi:hypothetical protein ACC841_36430, partial [Rhizobium ruizarguesonis]